MTPVVQIETTANCVLTFLSFTFDATVFVHSKQQVQPDPSNTSRRATGIVQGAVKESYTTPQ